MKKLPVRDQEDVMEPAKEAWREKLVSKDSQGVRRRKCSKKE